MGATAPFRGMLERDRRREGLTVRQAARRLGVTVPEYRELVEGEAWPSYDVWERILVLTVALTTTATATEATGPTALIPESHTG